MQHYRHPTRAQGEMSHLPADSRPEGMENKAKSQPNHLIFAGHNHGPCLGEHRRQSNEPFGPRLGRLLLTALSNVGMVVSPRFTILGGRFGTFHMAMKHFPNAPLFSTYKRRLPPPHLNNNTQEKSTRAREEQHHSWA